MSNSLQHRYCSLTAHLSMGSPGKNNGVGCHALLQGIFPNQGLNLGTLLCRQILYREAPFSQLYKYISYIVCVIYINLFFRKFFVIPYFLFLHWLQGNKHLISIIFLIKVKYCKLGLADVILMALVVKGLFIIYSVILKRSITNTF